MSSLARPSSSIDISVSKLGALGEEYNDESRLTSWVDIACRYESVVPDGI